MAEFMLIVPGGMFEVAIDDILNNTVFTRDKFPTFEGGTDLPELTEALRIANLIPEGKTEVVGLTYLAEFDRLWIRFE